MSGCMSSKFCLPAGHVRPRFCLSFFKWFSQVWRMPSFDWKTLFLKSINNDFRQKLPLQHAFRIRSMKEFQTVRYPKGSRKKTPFSPKPSSTVCPRDAESPIPGPMIGSGAPSHQYLLKWRFETRDCIGTQLPLSQRQSTSRS